MTNNYAEFMLSFKNTVKKKKNNLCYSNKIIIVFKCLATGKEKWKKYAEKVSMQKS